MLALEHFMFCARPRTLIKKFILLCLFPINFYRLPAYIILVWLVSGVIWHNSVYTLVVWHNSVTTINDSQIQSQISGLMAHQSHVTKHGLQKSWAGQGTLNICSGMPAPENSSFSSSNVNGISTGKSGSDNSASTWVGSEKLFVFYFDLDWNRQIILLTWLLIAYYNVYFRHVVLVTGIRNM